MSDDILETLRRNSVVMRRNGWGSATLDVAAEEIQRLRAQVAALEAENAKVRERTARECAAICDSVTDEEVRPTGTSAGGYCAELIRNKFGVTG